MKLDLGFLGENVQDDKKSTFLLVNLFQSQITWKLIRERHKNIINLPFIWGLPYQRIWTSKYDSAQSWTFVCGTLFSLDYSGDWQFRWPVIFTVLVWRLSPPPVPFSVVFVHFILLRVNRNGTTWRRRRPATTVKVAEQLNAKKRKAREEWRP